MLPLISPTKTINQLQIDKNRESYVSLKQRKLWTTTKQQQKPCRAQKPRTTAQKSEGNILAVSPHLSVQSSLAPGRRPSKDFHPVGKRRAAEPQQNSLLWTSAAVATESSPALSGVLTTASAPGAGPEVRAAPREPSCCCAPLSRIGCHRALPYTEPGLPLLCPQLSAPGHKSVPPFLGCLLLFLPSPHITALTHRHRGHAPAAWQPSPGSRRVALTGLHQGHAAAILRLPPAARVGPLTHCPQLLLHSVPWTQATPAPHHLRACAASVSLPPPHVSH